MRVSAGVCLHAVAAVIFIVAGAPPPTLSRRTRRFCFQRYVACTAGLVHSQHNNQMHRLRTCFRLPVIASKQCDAAAVLGGQLVETVVEEEWWKYVQDLPHVRVD